MKHYFSTMMLSLCAGLLGCGSSEPPKAHPISQDQLSEQQAHDALVQNEESNRAPE